MALIRLAYISRATFRSMDSHEGVEPSVARILAVSRRNNIKKGIVGGLYFGDGYFFQYLEGERDAVYGTFERIRADSRHKDVRIMLEGKIGESRFLDWSMKYVPLAGEVAQLLRRHKRERFDPYDFSPQMFEELITLIQGSSDRDSLSLSAREGRPSKRPSGRAERSEQIALYTAAAVLVVGVLVGGFLVLYQ